MLLRMSVGAWEMAIPSAPFQNYVHHLNSLDRELRGIFFSLYFFRILKTNV